jgi:anti-anti-sigma factor
MWREPVKMTTFEMRPDGHGFILSGELDMANAVEFQAALTALLPIPGPATIDMRKLRFIDSSGISAIMSAARAGPDACIVLHGVHDQVDRVIEMTGIDGMLTNLHVIPCVAGMR